MTRAGAVLVLLLLGEAGAQPAVPHSKTPPATWSKDGWSDFKWRMGPGDVVDLLMSPANPLYGGTLTLRAPANDDESYDVASPHLEIAGEAMDVTFKFFEGQLYLVYITPRNKKLTYWLWKRRTLKLLTEKYGVAEEVDGSHHWSLPVPHELHVALLDGPAIMYVESAALSRVTRLRERKLADTERNEVEAARRKQEAAREKRLRDDPDLRRL